jgi:hypothetical protein
VSKAASVALGFLALACGAGAPDAGPQVTCRDVDAGYAAIHRGDDALAACVTDPRMQQEGHRREARLGPGRYDFGDGGRLELGSGWTIEGAGIDATTLFPSRPTTAVFDDDLRSLLLVRGARVRLAGFTFDGACGAGPSPDPACADHAADTLLALVVEDVRVLHVKTPFLATSSEPKPEHGRKGLFANFRDFEWTIRRFQVSGRADGFRYARVFELGNAATAILSQGPGVGVSERRRYRVRLEELAIDAPVGKTGGQLAGVLTIALNAPVSLEVDLVRSRLAGTERVAGIATHTVRRPGADAGHVLVRCEDSALVADPRDWEDRLRRKRGSLPCPPHTAAVSLGEFSRPGGIHRARLELRRCEVRAEPFLALCPAPASVDLGPPELAPHTSLCLEDSRLAPPARGAGAVETTPCLTPGTP